MTSPALNLAVPEQFKQLVAETSFLVEATSFERYCLWERHSPDSLLQQALSDHREFRNIPLYDPPVFKFEQHGVGWFANVCDVTFEQRLMPLNVVVSWDYIGPHRQLVAFYELTSMVTHFDIARNWLDKIFTKVPHTNAQNFHICLQALKLL